MSGGTNAQTNYPAAILGGLWTDANQAFSPYPWGGTQGQNNPWGFQGGTSTTSNIGNVAAGNILGYNNQPGGANQQNSFGYNPSQTASGANYLTGLGPSLGQQGQSENSYLLGQGQNINAQLQGAAGGIQNTLQGAGQNVYNQTQQNAQGLGGYANQALTNAFDPQKALFAQQFQQQQAQNLASQSQAGVAQTPYGTGLSQQGNQNFDIAWQQAQLANQAQGANTASTLLGQSANQLGTGVNALTGAYGAGANALQGLYGTGANALQGLSGVGSSNLSNLLGAGTSAYNTGATQGMNQNQYGQQQQQQQIQDFLGYLTGSSGNSANYINALAQLYNASTGQYSAANQGQANQAQINAGGLSGLGSALGGIGGLLGGLL